MFILTTKKSLRSSYNIYITLHYDNYERKTNYVILLTALKIDKCETQIF